MIGQIRNTRGSDQARTATKPSSPLGPQRGVAAAPGALKAVKQGSPLRSGEGEPQIAILIGRKDMPLIHTQVCVWKEGKEDQA